MINFRKFAKEGKGICVCKEVQARLNKHAYKAPKVGGHIAFIGSQYEGPFKQLLQQNCTNTPVPTYEDDVRMATRLWEECTSKLPAKWQNILWEGEMGSINGRRWNLTPALKGQLKNSFRSTEGAVGSIGSNKEVHLLRKLIKGLCVSTLGKNGG